MHWYDYWVAVPVFLLFPQLYQYRMQYWAHYKHYSIGTAGTNGYLWESKYHWATFGHDHRNSLFEGLTIDLTQPFMSYWIRPVRGPILMILVMTFPYSKLLQYLFYSSLQPDCSWLISYDILTAFSVGSTADFPLIDYFSHDYSSWLITYDTLSQIDLVCVPDQLVYKPSVMEQPLSLLSYLFDLINYASLILLNKLSILFHPIIVWPCGQYYKDQGWAHA